MSLLVGGLAFAAYLFGVRGFGAWQQTLALENTAHQLLEQVARDLYQASHLTFLNDSTVALATPAGPPITYQYTGQRLIRQGRAMHRAEVAVIEFSLRSTADSEAVLPSWQATLTLRQGERHRQVQADVTLRQHTYWQHPERP